MFFKKYTANDWCSSKLKLTPAQCFLENYLQHPKKSYFSDIYTEWNDSHFLVQQMTWIVFHHLCKKAQKSVKKLEKKYFTNNLCIIDAVQICNSSMHHFKYFWESEVETLGLGCERKHDLIHQQKVNKACKFICPNKV